MKEPAPDDAFVALRPKLFGIAYRMTGSATDADDAVQDAWLRWQAVDHAAVHDAEAYLVRIVTRIGLDRLKSAQRRREHYVGPFLPEPIIGPPDDEPARVAELADSLTFAFLVVLDELAPIERAVVLLHDVFGYEFEEVARATGRTPAACRQTASRARRRLAQHREATMATSRGHERRMIDSLVATAVRGDVEGLMALLAPDVVQLDDGGAARRAARRPVIGPHRVARLLLGLTRRMIARPGHSAQVTLVNGTLGLVARRDGRPDVVLTFEYAPDGRIRRIYGQANPEKLAHLT